MPSRGALPRRRQPAAIMEKYRLQDIYALTGATISTDAVVMGIKAMTKKFAYRIETLDAVLADQPDCRLVLTRRKHGYR